MSFRFTDFLKGRVAERVLTSLFERGGYRVTRLGIEELFDEIKYLDREHYLSLGLPDQLRTLPDLLVADPGVNWAKLIEVKFRRRFDWQTSDELYIALTDQRRYWPDSYAVIIRSEASRTDSGFHQDYIRVVPPDQTAAVKSFRAGVELPSTEREVMERIWEQLPTLNCIFRFRDFEHFGAEGKDRGSDFWTSADHITKVIRELA